MPAGVLAVVGGLLLAGASATPSLQIDESEIRLDLEPGRETVSLPVRNPGKATTLVAEVALVDPTDERHAAGRKSVLLRPGAQVVTIPLSFTRRPGTDRAAKALALHRLSYRLSPETDGGRAFLAGLVAVSQIASPFHVLDVACSPRVRPGMPYRVLARVSRPSGRPMAGAEVTATLELDDGSGDHDESGRPRRIQRSGRTDGQGVAVLDLDLPSPLGVESVDLQVESRYGVIAETVEESLDVDSGVSIHTSTDKGLYQPGQTLHGRVLVLDGARRAVAGAAAAVRIRDPEGTIQLSAEAETSRFGIARVDWEIPEGAKLGHYTIETQLDGDVWGSNAAARETVTIGRYELPQFRVTVSPDRPYFLPAQEGGIEVAIDYLFGKPVAGARVRVVRESERRWDSGRQGWEVTEGASYDAVAGRDGRCRMALDLSLEHAAIGNPAYRAFDDVTFAAYATDPTTGRTEQRRFDLRVTREPVHVYVHDDEAGGNAVYVTASYADGSPVRGRITLVSEDDPARTASGRTSRYGAAKLALPRGTETTTEWSAQVVDESGRMGTSTGGVYRRFHPLTLDVERTVLRPGEPIEVSLRLGTKDAPSVLAVVELRQREGVVLRSRVVRVGEGGARIRFPYEPRFKGPLAVGAYPLDADSRFEGVFRGVLYPSPRRLSLDVRSDRKSYRPGEEARLDVAVRPTAGRAVESALGLVVIDAALDERIRTDREFGAGLGFYGAFLRDDERFGSVRLDDLLEREASEPFDPDLDLVAELLLARRWYPTQVVQSLPQVSAARAFEAWGRRLAERLRPLLDTRYPSNAAPPEDVEGLLRSLDEAGLDLAAERDPWDRFPLLRLETQGARRRLTVSSAGPDEKAGTDDDFVVLGWDRPYFAARGVRIDAAVRSFHERTGGFLREPEALLTELRAQGDDFAAWRDPWGRPHSLEIVPMRTTLVARVLSAGPDPAHPGDDVLAWTSVIDTFADTRRAIGDLLEQRGDVPLEDGAAFLAFLEGNALSPSQLLDHWGHPYEPDVLRVHRYTDVTRYNVTSDGPAGEPQLKPEAPLAEMIRLRSAGPDGSLGTGDDFEAAAFERYVGEPGRRDVLPLRRHWSPVLMRGRGGIDGTVVDMTGGVIPGAQVKVLSYGTGESRETTSDADGRFSFGLAPGVYKLSVSMVGFREATYDGVAVTAGALVWIDVRLDVGAMCETIAVAAESPVLNTSAAMRMVESRGAASPPLLTPRVRRYFPETLFWVPEIVTDGGGRARVSFPLADSLTTWKVSALASTLDGRIGVADAEIQTFQPFFVDYDPPAVLTKGDEVALPSVVRSYLDGEQDVTLDVDPGEALTALEPPRRRVAVAPGEGSRQTFTVRASGVAESARQRFAVRGSHDADAVEKTLRVVPNGREVVHTDGSLLLASHTFTFDVPAEALPDTARARLTVYPSLLHHVVEAVEGILERPHGCGEQTISSTYPSLMVLRHQAASGGPPSPVAGRARRYLQQGYERLLSYQTADGGFAYWPDDRAPDVALTAYALRFLADAGELLEVDEEVVSSAARWLAALQAPSGAWRGDPQGPEDTRLTASVARSLAAGGRSETLPALARAVDFLAGRVDTIQDPYVLANVALAAPASSDVARRARARLAAAVRSEGDTLYWDLQSNTAFSGWGFTGRVETTALVVVAFAAETGPERDRLVDGGLRFLLRTKDRYGVWYSSQATVAVLDTLLELIAAAPQTGDRVDVVVNGKALPPMALEGEAVAALDLSPHLVTGTNTVVIRRAAGAAAASAQVVVGHHVPWEAPRPDETAPLALGVTFDATQVDRGQPVACRVRAERRGFRGYGMIVAEIGLPPGAEADRGSLERTKAAEGVDAYEVRPDRVVFYLWPEAGGSSFDFVFRPRLGMKAVTTPSSLWDYYNPEAAVVVPPAVFEVRE